MNSAGLGRIAGKATGPVGLIGAIGGFISDVLAPLGAVAPAVAGISVLAAIIFGIMTYLESRNNRRDIWDTAYSGGLFVSICSVLIFSIWGVVLAAGPERGYLAENVDPIAQVQAQLLGLQEDVTEIKETTAETAENVETIATVQAEGNEDIEAMATAQAQGFADIQAAFATLQQNQTIVENPTTPQEFYSNARLYQLKGNTAEAVKAYEGYLQFNLEYVDPVQDYADLLKATEGIARAREIVNTRLSENPGSLVTDFVATSMLETADERMPRYQALTSRAPEFGPAYLGLAQTVEVKMAEGGGFRAQNEQLFAAYDKLQELESQQNFSRYYIDKNRAIDLYDTAMRSYEFRQGAASSSTLLSQPEIFISPSQTGLTFTFIIADSVAEWLVSFDDPDNLRGLGVTQTQLGDVGNSTLTDQPLPVGDHIIYYQYVDKNGVESELFEYPLTVYPIVGMLNVQPADFTTGKSTISGVVYAYLQPEDKAYDFYWGLSEDDITNGSGMPAFSLATITVPDLEPGEYTVWVRADGTDGEVLGPVPFPLVVQ